MVFGDEGVKHAATCVSLMQAMVFVSHLHVSPFSGEGDRIKESFPFFFRNELSFLQLTR